MFNLSYLQLLNLIKKTKKQRISKKNKRNPKLFHVKNYNKPKLVVDITISNHQ